MSSKTLSVINGIIGTGCALWLYNNFVGWLTFLSAAIPPVACSNPQGDRQNRHPIDTHHTRGRCEVQERMTLSGQLDPVLVENDSAGGRLWDMSAGQLKRGDYQLIVKYGEFLSQQPDQRR